jgi:hypothetical protein
MRPSIVLTIAAACSACSVTTNPDQITFAGNTYLVTYAGGVSIDGRAFGEGTLLVHDFNGDDRDDFALYMDTRDGFRDTFSYLDIYVDDGRSLALAAAEQAKWKEGHWAWIDASQFPGLDDSRFRRFMREQDDKHDSWF